MSYLAEVQSVLIKAGYLIITTIAVYHVWQLQ